MAGFRKAKPKQAALKIGMYGPQGSGKTLTSLLVAEGLSAISGKRIACVDTERGTDFYSQDIAERTVHSKAFDFDAFYSRSLVDTLNEIRQLDERKYGVIIVDSITHLWEAAKNSYAGKLTSQGGIPIHAWANIKRPYKQLMSTLLSSPMHVIICGRQGIDMKENEITGESMVVGYKMKAESETPYEPHMLIKMDQVKQKGLPTIIRAFIEKDRSSVLMGKYIDFPSFDTIAEPILPYLGLSQAPIESEDEAGARDAVALVEEGKRKETDSANMARELVARIQLTKTGKELAAINKDITPELKKKMLASDVAAVREAWMDADSRLKGA